MSASPILAPELLEQRVEARAAAPLIASSTRRTPRALGAFSAYAVGLLVELGVVFC
jgi:hypothetical protein